MQFITSANRFLRNTPCGKINWQNHDSIEAIVVQKLRANGNSFIFCRSCDWCSDANLCCGTNVFYLNIPTSFLITFVDSFLLKGYFPFPDTFLITFFGPGYFTHNVFKLMVQFLSAQLNFFLVRCSFHAQFLRLNRCRTFHLWQCWDFSAWDTNISSIFLPGRISTGKIAYIDDETKICHKTFQPFGAMFKLLEFCRIQLDLHVSYNDFFCGNC